MALWTVHVKQIREGSITVEADSEKDAAAIVDTKHPDDIQWQPFDETPYKIVDVFYESPAVDEVE